MCGHREDAGAGVPQCPRVTPCAARSLRQYGVETLTQGALRNRRTVVRDNSRSEAQYRVDCLRGCVPTQPWNWKGIAWAVTADRRCS